MEGRCGRCGRVYEISDDFVALGGRAKCPHCLLELRFEQREKPAREDDRFWEATKPDPRRKPQPAPASAEPQRDEIDAACGSCGRHYKVDREYLEGGGEALCPHCGVELEFAEGDEVSPSAPEAEPEAESGTEFEQPADEAADGGWDEIEQQLVGALDGGEEAADDEQQPGWFATAQIDLPELELLRRRAEGDLGGEAVPEQQLGADGEPGAEESGDEQPWQPAAGDDLAERQETDVWQAPGQEGDSWSIDENDLPETRREAEELEEADTRIDQEAPARWDLDEDQDVGEPGAAEEDSAPPAGAEAGGGDLDQQLGLEISAEETVQLDEKTGLPAGGDEDLGDIGGDEDDEEALPPEPEGDQPGEDGDVSGGMLSLFDDISDDRSIPGAGRLDLEAPELEEEGQAGAADPGTAVEMTGDYAGDDAEWPAEPEQEQQAGEPSTTMEMADDSAGEDAEWPAEPEQEQQAAEADAERSTPSDLDVATPDGPAAASSAFSGLVSSEDWAQAAARWAQSGFSPQAMPDFMAGEQAEELPEAGQQGGAEQHTPEPAPQPAPVDDAAPVEVSDADILMVGEDDVELLKEEPAAETEPAGAARPGDHWAERASRELEVEQRQRQPERRQRSPVLRLLANPFVAGALGIAVLAVLVLVWWSMAGSEDIQGAVFPVSGLPAQPVEAPPPSPYQANRRAVEHYALGNRLAHQGKFEDAILEYKQAIRLDPAFPHPHRALGVMYAALGRKALSAAAYENYLRLAPDTGDAAQVRQIVEASKKQAR